MTPARRRVAVTLHRPPAARLGLVLLLVSAMAVAANVAAQPARAEAPARWTPVLLDRPSELRLAPGVALGSPEDRKELDAIVAKQAQPLLPKDRIAYWTDVPSAVRWNEILLAIVRDAKTNPIRAARALALLNAAMYDAIIAACDAKVAHRREAPAQRDSRIRALAPFDDLSSHASVDAAVAAAATAVLTALYPDRTQELSLHAADLHRARLVAGTHTASDLAAGTALGEAVGERAVLRATGDGAGAVWDGIVPEGPGLWMPARPFRLDTPTEPMAGTWRPWLMATGSAFRPGPPPAFGSTEWQAEADEVVRVNEDLTDDEVRIARFWADGAGSDTPAGHWMRIAIELADRDRLPMAETARVLVHLGLAQADAFIACWDAKFTYWSGRPAALIPNFASTVITPNFPAYVSGHSTLSGASSTVLGAFFPGDAAALAAQGEEAAVSRLYGGIHWRSDNVVGLTVGRQVGELAVARARSMAGLP